MAMILALTAWVVTRVPASTSVGKLVPGPWGGDDDDDTEFPGISA
jgi:hypothetical protein